MATEPAVGETQAYDGFDAGAWEYLRNHRAARKSVNFIYQTIPGELGKKFAVADVALTFIGDGVKQPRDGHNREEFLDVAEAMFLAMVPANYSEYRQVLEQGDPAGYLIPGGNERITSKKKEELLKTFYSLYSHQDYERVSFMKDKLEEFVDGLRLKLDKEGGVFSREELQDYYRRVQCEPTIICMNAAVNLQEELPAGVNYRDFYESLNDISIGLKQIKKCRESDILEDAARGLIYFPREDLEYVGLTPNEFMDAVESGQEDARLSELVKRTVHEGYARIRRGGHTLMDLPNEGLWLGMKRFAAAYGGLLDHWARELQESGYNPLNGRGYMNPGPAGERELLDAARSVGTGPGRDQELYRQITGGNHLDRELLAEMQERIGYRGIE